MRNTRGALFLPAFLSLILYVSQFFGCASIQHPTGGPRDSVAPKIIKENPKNFTTNFKSREVDIEFDEYFKLSNEFKEISVSPAMEKNPDFKIRKKVLNIEFQEALQANTTYTINFGNAIADFNEGNILKNYVYVFSTGNKIDSLSISGTVKNTLTKEPILDATVFLLPVNQDSLFGKKRASLFTTSDSSGNFKLNYLREDTYNIYALKEQGGDKIYNSTNEFIAFNSQPIRLTKDTTGINLEVFQEQPLNFRIVDRKIEKDGRFTFIFNQQLKKPRIEILQPSSLNTGKFVEFTNANDTAFVWTKSMDFDSINVAIYDEAKGLDTVVIRRGRKDSYDQAITMTSNVASGRLRPGSDVLLTLSAPISNIDGRKFSLLQDSVQVTGLRVARDSSSNRRILLRYPWKIEKNYILNISENAFTGTFGGTNKAFSAKFVRDLEDNYGVLSTVVAVPDTAQNYILQLLNEQDKVLIERLVQENITLNFPQMAIGKYSVRIIYDKNRNGKWDTGSVKDKRQPEPVWNYPTEISLRANFDMEEKITIPKAP